jgi:ubiquitin-conjugating enzyme E2 W
VIEVTGAAGTLYAGETYQLQVDFPEHYPMEAPQVRFSQQRLHIQFMIISSIVLCSLHLIGRLHHFCFQVIFLNPAPMHPHIYSNGHICLGNKARFCFLCIFSYGEDLCATHSTSDACFC